MRRYRFRATSETLDALSHLQSPWIGYTWNEARFLVGLKGKRFVKIEREEKELEPKFYCSRVIAQESPWGDSPLGHLAFSTDHNRIFAIESKEWIEIEPTSGSTTLGHHPEIRCSGKPGAEPESALACCSVTKGVLVLGSRGRRIVIHCGWPTMKLEIITNDQQIDDLVERFLLVEVSPDTAA